MTCIINRLASWPLALAAALLFGLGCGYGEFTTNGDPTSKGGGGAGAGADDPGSGSPSDTDEDSDSQDPAPDGDVCGNGLDDDQDGEIDEACPCDPGATQPCWPGDPSRRGVGECHDGTQVCEAQDEFAMWGPCTGYGLPAMEDIAGDGLDSDCDGSDGGDGCWAEEFGKVCSGGFDEDCDGLADCADPDCAWSAKCPTPCAAAEDCADGIDNDCDGLPDCLDWYECGSTPWCYPCDPAETCGDSVDNDCDGSTDCGDADCAGSDACVPGCTYSTFGLPTCTDPDCCADPDCSGSASCVPACPAESCSNGIDDDCDGLVDCTDADCSSAPSCVPACPAESCSNGIDDDCDGLIDCADADCAPSCDCECIPGGVRWCDTPTYCTWGQQTCTPAGTWGACIEVAAPAGCAGYYYYNTSCCLSLPDACCQNYPWWDSVGECAGDVCGM